MLITRSRLSSTRDIRLFISFREAMADVQRFDLLDPAEVARFGGIEIVAQGVVEGFLSGIHRSPFRGFSVEFTEHRAYQPGDELRYLDWKILARADRLFVKQFEQETNLRAMILVDVSRSVARRAHPAHQTGLCRSAGRGARADLAATARCHGADHLRRSRARGGAGASE